VEISATINTILHTVHNLFDTNDSESDNRRVLFCFYFCVDVYDTYIILYSGINEMENQAYTSDGGGIIYTKGRLH